VESFLLKNYSTARAVAIARSQCFDISRYIYFFRVVSVHTDRIPPASVSNPRDARLSVTSH
jgi:hypothetical protein